MEDYTMLIWFIQYKLRIYEYNTTENFIIQMKKYNTK